MEVKVSEDNIKRMRRNHRNRKRKNKVIIIICLFLIILIVLGIILIKKNKIQKIIKEDKSETQIITETLIGKWTTDGNTVYEFNEGGKGTLIVPVAKLPFTYKLENNQLFIDFENEDSEDSSYNYMIEDNKLSMQNSNGTFVFSRVEEE